MPLITRPDHRPQLTQVLVAHDVLDAVGGREAVHAEDVGKVPIGTAVAAAEARRLRHASAPHAEHRDQQILQCDVPRLRLFLTGWRLPPEKRRNRQDSVRLLADPDRRQRAGRAHVLAEVLPRPLDVFRRQRSRQHLAQEISPRRRPDGAVHVTGVERLVRASVYRVGQRALVLFAEPERRRKNVGVRSIVRTEEAACELRLVAFVGVGVARAESRWRIGRVVGRRALQHKAQAVRVVVRVEQAHEIRRAVRRSLRRRRLDAEHEEEVEPLRLVGVQARADRHAHLCGRVVVHHPAHALVDGQFVGPARRRDLRGIGAGGELIGNRRAERREHQRAVTVAHHAPARRQHPRTRRTRPRASLCRRRGKRDRLRKRLILRDRFRRLLGRVERRERLRHPRRAMGIETFDELTPRAPACRIVGRRTPHLLPEVPAPDDLLIGQFRLVRVHVQWIGIDAHTQVRAAVASRGEARFETHGEQDERLHRTGHERQRQIRCRRNSGNLGDSGEEGHDASSR